MQAYKRKEIKDFLNHRLEASLDDPNLIINGKGEFNSLYLQDINNDLNSGVRHEEDKTTPDSADYGDMHTEKRPEDDHKEAVDKYLNVKLIMNVGTNNKRC